MSDPGDLYPTAIPDATQPRMYGVVVGVVTNNNDPLRLGRVKVSFPWLADLAESAWARVATPMAGKGRGLYLLPEIDEEVLLAFQHGQAELPVVIGSLWNNRDRPPDDNADGNNNRRLLRSRSGHTIVLDDSEGAERIEIADAGGNKIVISSREKSITIEAKGDMRIEAKGNLTLSGNQVTIEARAGAALKSRANLQLEASAQLVIRGQLVNIN